ncbi:hypothetical protein [Planomonospora sp. ID82291]|uniref:hypothetical protein n=1 Tax=Planomonospora sp. ID82291 TaxID=2738136 RepID=UPI0018C3E158|nr:hypothetical protein [Planomonospora sp. ID82291]MBG0818753.1 hypothetical protein [Planomonospora sp. ID82291]
MTLTQEVPASPETGPAGVLRAAATRARTSGPTAFPDPRLGEILTAMLAKAAHRFDNEVIVDASARGEHGGRLVHDDGCGDRLDGPAGSCECFDDAFAVARFLLDPGGRDAAAETGEGS